MLRLKTIFRKLTVSQTVNYIKVSNDYRPECESRTQYDTESIYFTKTTRSDHCHLAAIEF